MTPELDVVGIGHAVVDVIARCEEGFISTHGLAKGHMRLIDAEEVSRLYAAMGPAVEISGGSAANSIAGIASLGGRAAFIGKTGADEFGRIFRHDIASIGVRFDTPPGLSGVPTSRSLILVTPDGQRTMNTHIGASPDIAPDEITAATIEAARITYLEGYLFDQPQAKRAFERAAEIARRAGRQVALSLSDGFCVERHRDEFLELIRGHVDILLANSDEITSLYRCSFEEAVERARADCPLSALTRSAQGSLIVARDGITQIAAAPVAEVVDTTGAGDLYAAGFLFGLARDLGRERAGELGSLAAAEAIGHLGARPETSLAALAAAEGLLPS